MCFFKLIFMNCRQDVHLYVHHFTYHWRSCWAPTTFHSQQQPILVPRDPLTRLKRSLSSASVHVRGLGANNLIPHLAIGSMYGRFTYIYHTKSTNFRYIYIYHTWILWALGFGERIFSFRSLRCNNVSWVAGVEIMGRQRKFALTCVANWETPNLCERTLKRYLFIMPAMNQYPDAPCMLYLPTFGLNLWWI